MSCSRGRGREEDATLQPTTVHATDLGWPCVSLCIHNKFYASTVSSSVYLRHHTITSRFPLYHYRFVTSLVCSSLRLSIALFLILSLQGFFVSLSVCYVTLLSLQGFHGFVSLSVYYVTVLF